MTIKVAHISTSSTGGAGIASRTLHRALNSNGIDSVFFTLAQEYRSQERHENVVVPSELKRVFMRSLTGINLMIGSDPFFSLYSSSSKHKLKNLVQDRNIIHIHNFYNFLKVSEIGELSTSAKIIITLHDQRFLTGGCHYTMGCKEFQNRCERCPKVPRILHNAVESNRISSFQDFFDSRLTLVTPSEWLYRIAVSNFGSNTNIVKIPNVVNYSATTAPSVIRFGKTIVVGFAAAQNQSLVKGTDVVTSIENAMHTSGLNVIFVRPKSYQGDMEVFWSSIHVLFVPSRIDNLPNVISEAHCRGIPVIAREVGGIPEMLFQEFDVGYDREHVSKAFFLELLLQIREFYSYEKAKRVRNAVIHSSNNALQKHVQMYEQLVNFGPINFD